MAFSVMTYNNLQISPYQLKSLLELKIERKINDHAKLYFTGVVPEEEKDKYVESTKAQTIIEVKQVDEVTGTMTLFKGIATSVKVKAVRDIYYIEVQAISCTYNLDIKQKSRSFQNKAMTYSALVKKILADYSGADFIDTASNGKALEKFTIQYNETDWQFIKRMASRFNAPLIPDSTSDKAKFWFGIPKGAGSGNLDDFNYSVSKKIAKYRTSSENTVKGVQENDYIYYDVETDKPLGIGFQVQYKGKNLYIYEATTLMKDNTLKHRYLMSPEKGFSQNTIYNNQLIGLSINGKVIEVSKDELKIHLEIDKEQNKAEAWLFKYSSVYTAEGNSGWYCMPELNDTVRAYFPDNKDENAIAISSVRQDNKSDTKLSDPNVKYFRTKSGRELMFSPNQVLISAKDGEIFIKMDEKDGIEIVSKKPIKISCEDNIMVDSQKKVVISAKDEISISCKDSSIKMDGDVTIKGKQVKAN